MCGRFVSARKRLELLEEFAATRDAVAADRQPDYNVAPTKRIYTVLDHKEERELRLVRWGLVPSWAKDTSVGSRMINARSETVAVKPSFRAAFAKRRCLIPASGFYEWKKNPDGKTKTPMYIRMKDAKPFAFAGLWETWHSPDGSELRSCTLITGEPNELIASIHDRMPAILDANDYRRWLDPKERDASDLMPLLKPYPAEKMEAFPVSRAVNNPSNEVPGCIEPLAGPDDPPLAAQKPAKPKKASARARKSEADTPSLFD